jgi:hypothetical protein
MEVAFKNKFPSAPLQGALKNITDLDVVGWFLGGQKGTRAGRISPRFLSCVLTPLAEKRPKTWENNRKKIGFGFFVDFFVKTFRHVFFVKRSL